MKRTVTALFDTRAQAEQVARALEAAGLGEHVDIADQNASSTEGPHKQGHHGWLHARLGGHHDAHAYSEGLRRGHVLLSVRVGELQEMRAAQIIESSTPVDLDERQQTWRSEGWTPPAPPTSTGAAPLYDTAAAPTVEDQDRAGLNRDADPGETTSGLPRRTRSYVVTDPVTYSQA